MKRFILSAFLLLGFGVLLAQDSLPTVSEAQESDEKKENTTLNAQAIGAYDKGDYTEAVDLFKAELEQQKKEGQEAAGLYYNLGNAYFRSNDVAKAILNYERALLLNPGDKDIRHNIDYANTRIEDKILVADQFVLTSWFLMIENLMSSNQWAVFAIGCFLLLGACLVLFFFSKQVFPKKIAFYTGIVMITFVILANVFSYRQKKEIEHRNSAIVMVGSASVHSSPDSNSKELFILHSGTKVVVLKEDRSWLEIEISDGNVGWIKRNMIEII